jgi:4-aminobutyrate aminotransferase-like enzyme
MGNGHPIGAVVTTTEIADAFNNGMEFFSSFGGNPVSMEVGMAVLNTIEEEGLQENAKIVGDHFKSLAKGLAKTYPQIGDVRCEGLFLGLELIDPNTTMPATKYASHITNTIKDQFILTSTDGPFNNVLKLKPPLCFTKANVDQFFDVFESVLRNKSW